MRILKYIIAEYNESGNLNVLTLIESTLNRIIQAHIGTCCSLYTLQKIRL